ncbi:energy transducer TonB [Rhodanobacter sp. DHG33]|uniref:energy transducer TonB n=1 Tax=Rhodanobacter sp. DHG33 TaxID=2775921 RepID=UPI0017819F9A|nr:energy transducer TonB [Rhodanobacter sp. DHG33]MBD8897649.1 energy transducer TonB [Rhodanobacter sp. DHG33]
MDTRYSYIAHRRVRGAARPVVIAIVAIVVALAAAAWFLIVRPYREQMQLDAGGVPTVPAAGNTQAATSAAPANLQALDVNQLLDEASKALKQQRYLAPAGNNAFEFYLRVLAKQPGNPVATSALRETFPYAASDAEQAVNSRSFDEAQREIDLLAKADPANFTLTILRSKLDAQRKLADQQQEQAQNQQKAAQLAAEKAAADKAEAAKQAEQQQAQQAQVAEQAKAKQQKVAEQPQSTQPQSTQAATPAAATGQTTGAVLVKRAQANYPTAALRANQSGWVLVGFTVTADGRTSDVHVVDAQPRHVFDRAATEAVSRYRFTPAMRDGNPVESTSQQRIEFSTGH